MTSVASASRRTARLASSLGCDLLAEAGEADKVGEADGDLARSRQPSAAALGGVDRLALGHFAQMQR